MTKWKLDVMAKSEERLAVATDEIPQVDWFPCNRKPISPSDWEKLERQALVFASSSINTFKDAVESQMPTWFIQQCAKTKYRLIRRYHRVKRRAAEEKQLAIERLLHAVFGETNRTSS